MAFTSFSEFLQLLEKKGELIRISDPVDTNLEITQISDIEMKKENGGKAILFEKPIVNGKISSIPLAINTLGSFKRMAHAMGRNSINEISEEIQGFIKARPPKGFKEGISLLKKGISLLHVKPNTTKKADCQEVVHILNDKNSKEEKDPTLPATLLDFPILKCWPDDGGRFITLPQVFTEDPVTKVRNVGMYRMQIYDSSTTGMHWQIHKIGARHEKDFANMRMPVSVAIGGDPVLTIASMSPLPDGIDEVLFSGFLRKKGVSLVKCKTNDLLVPANSDIILEGYVDPSERKIEGPFGDHTGFYTEEAPYPVFHITAITHKKNAIYPSTIVGYPPMEDYYMGMAVTHAFLPIIKSQFPEIVNLTMPACGVFHNFVFVSIKKQYPYQAYKVMHGLWGLGQMMFAKFIIVVDYDVDVNNTNDVLFALGANTDPKRDSIFTKSPLDSLDHAPNVENIGSHMGIDATKKLKGEGYHRTWPKKITMDKNVVEKINKMMGLDSTNS